jgi:hypothetical protein
MRKIDGQIVVHNVGPLRLGRYLDEKEKTLVVVHWRYGGLLARGFAKDRTGIVQPVCHKRRSKIQIVSQFELLLPTRKRHTITELPSVGVGEGTTGRPLVSNSYSANTQQPVERRKTPQ